MKLEDLYGAIKKLGEPNYYHLNDNTLDMFVLKYNKWKNVWEYYFLNERGGKSRFQVFATEDEACEHAYQDAISINNTFRDAFASLRDNKK